MCAKALRQNDHDQLTNRRKTSDFGNSWDLDRAGPEGHREELSFYPEMKSLGGEIHLTVVGRSDWTRLR